MTWLDSYQPFDGVRLNMIATPNGQFVGQAGSSREISNPLDRSLIIKLRELSDVYVTGGNTFRSEGYKKPNHGTLAVITQKPSQLPDGVMALDLDTALEKLRSLGYRRILLEVGPHLAAKFLSENLVDEFCLTVPKGRQVDARGILDSFGANLVLESESKIEDTLFTRWRRGND